jgi:hypothetical protein
MHVVAEQKPESTPPASATKWRYSFSLDLRDVIDEIGKLAIGCAHDARRGEDEEKLMSLVGYANHYISNMEKELTEARAENAPVPAKLEIPRDAEPGQEESNALHYIGRAMRRLDGLVGLVLTPLACEPVDEKVFREYAEGLRAALGAAGSEVRFFENQAMNAAGLAAPSQTTTPASPAKSSPPRLPLETCAHRLWTARDALKGYAKEVLHKNDLVDRLLTAKLHSVADVISDTADEINEHVPVKQ